jgi:VIT1/CCC1 family predicted Fe2+/Mn2+ transporter
MSTTPSHATQPSQLRVVSKRPQSSRRASVKRCDSPLGVVDQVSASLRPRARLATLLGFALGGFVPLASYVVAHSEIDPAVSLYAQVTTLLVLGGLLYSAKTVYAWGKLAFRAPAKAAGFVVLLEGVMVFAHTQWLSIAALAYLMAINGLATGCNLALDRKR